MTTTTTTSNEVNDVSPSRGEASIPRRATEAEKMGLDWPGSTNFLYQISLFVRYYPKQRGRARESDS